MILLEVKVFSLKTFGISGFEKLVILARIQKPSPNKKFQIPI
jgi:hypothetical protein